MNSTKAKIIQTTQGMLNGSVNYLLGAKRLLELRDDIGAYKNDPLFIPFVAVALELNQLSFELDNLKQLDSSQIKTLDESVEWAKEVSLNACYGLLERYLENPENRE